MVNWIKRLFKERKDIYWFFGFLLFGACYYGEKLFVHNYNIVHFPLDDKIPFLPIFIIPYILWFLYVPGMMVLVFFKDKESFKRQAITFFSGGIICILILFIYPTMIDFRPSAEGEGLLLWITRIVYANDVPPTNVFPSLHCYEALAVHLTTFTAGPFKDRKVLRAASFVLVVLICASTAFVKQHSYVDIIGGCAVAVIIFAVWNRIFKGKTYELDNGAV